MDSVTLKPVPTGTHQRLLDAAARVYARNGLEGATTREIAREAGVNEVTLFRHFQTKEKLLTAVVQRTLDQQDALAAPVSGPTPATPKPRLRTGKITPPDLRAALLDIARRYEEMLHVNMPLVRTLIGEIHRYSEHEVRVMKSIFMPFKTEMLGAIQAARRAGKLRTGIDVAVAADLFASMVFMEALRRCGPTAPDYTPAYYHAACADMILHGVAKPAR